MSEWKKARKKPVEVEFREVKRKERVFESLDTDGVWGEIINTLEGNHIAVAGLDFIIRGIKGELYPIKKFIFYQTYDVIDG